MAEWASFPASLTNILISLFIYLFMRNNKVWQLRTESPGSKFWLYFLLIVLCSVGCTVDIRINYKLITIKIIGTWNSV